MKFRLAQIQMPVYKEIRLSVEYMERMAARAAAMGADVIALPEMFACPYAVGNFPVYAQEERGPLWQTCRETARRLHVYLSAGTMRRETLLEKFTIPPMFLTARAIPSENTGRWHLLILPWKAASIFRNPPLYQPGIR